MGRFSQNTQAPKIFYSTILSKGPDLDPSQLNGVTYEKKLFTAQNH